MGFPKQTEMKITSLEIKQHEFEKSFRGYNIEEVNHFLANISQEWERMLNELKMLKMQLEISEKEASKLREVEMTLIKTLRTAEDTSSRITDNANQEANRKISEAEQKAEAILADAENTARTLVEEAQQKAENIHNTAKAEFSTLEKQFASLEAQKADLLYQLKQIAFDATQIAAQNQVNDYEKVEQKTELSEIPVAKAPEMVVEPLFEAPEEIVEEPQSVEAEDVPASDTQFEEEMIQEEEEESHGLSFSSAVNDISLETGEDKTNLEIIEGIGPKIKELLNKAHIISFRDLVNTPLYRIRDILDAGGPQFAANDPGTWIEQAELANKGEWDKLEELKSYLIAGRAPQEKPVDEDYKPNQPVEGSSTEEMLDKVNKVKAAIRKAMTDKAESGPKEVKSAADYIAEKKQTGSFFDNLN